MEKQKIFKKLLEIIAEEWGIPPEEIKKINMETTFFQDLGKDSLERYELFYAIEQKLNIRIPDEKEAEFETVGDPVEYISKNYD